MKPKTKKYLKISSLSIVSLGFVGLIIGVSTSWNGTKVINAGGSSAVLPLVSALSKNYNKSDIVVSAGGSGVGISSILNNTKEIGMVSKDPNMWKEKDLSSKEEKWKNIEAKTITIAWDGIAILYKAKSELDIKKESLPKIYKAFSGIDPNITIKDIMGNDDGDETKLIPFARNGGATTSGTADAFLNDSGFEKDELVWENNNEKDKIIEILKTGSYGSNIQQTGESNSQTWDRIKNEGNGAITYLSTGFVFNNYKEIKNKGFKIATYNGNELIKNEDDPINNNNVTNGYEWFRPFNLIISLKRISDDIKEFIKWILNEEDTDKIIKNQGYIPLREEEIESMTYEENLWVSDYVLKHCGAKKRII